MHLQESGEMYLETIYILSQKEVPVRVTDIGEYMGFSKPSVSRAVGLLKEGGFVAVNEEGHITLTDIGRETAQRTYERHTFLTEWFLRLGVCRDTASEYACKIEHDISEETFNAIKNFVKKQSDGEIS